MNMDKPFSEIIEVPKLERQNMVEVVFTSLRDNILSGKLTDGYQLPSMEALAKQCGVSRVVIREAMKKLSTFGLVESHQGRGTFVSSPKAKTILEPLLNTLRLDETSMQELMETRYYLEAITARLAAKRADEEEIARLKELIDQMEAHADDTDFEKFTNCDISFHIALAHSSHNEIFARVLETVRDMLAQLMMVKFLDGHERKLRITERAIYRHKEIIEAIIQRDPDKAEEVMRLHLADIFEVISKLAGYELEIPS
jgi:GntR family transcriptional repressor for pyruvate dehydrogenase complex